MTIAVIDYGIGNLHSAQKALRALGADAVLTDSSAIIKSSSAVVLPGVGNFGACMSAIRERGLDVDVDDAVASGKPFLGICVGMQMLFDSSEEAQGVSGLGIIPGVVSYLPSDVRRPQMQWNELIPSRNDPVLSGEGEPQWVYFVHSLAAQPEDVRHVAATVNYGGATTAACRHENVLAMQFHPEKSGTTGLAMLNRWLSSEGVVS
jgi:glutamine amidotransferase